MSILRRELVNCNASISGIFFWRYSTIGKFVKANIQSLKTIALSHIFYAHIFGMESETNRIFLIQVTKETKMSVNRKEAKLDLVGSTVRYEVMKLCTD